jgi:phosphoribosylformimino-5-aminoimidazole carboxamide ribonucleotide (ProFAR) isomerase
MIVVEVIPNPNCAEEIQLVFEEIGQPRVVNSIVRNGKKYKISGWDAEKNAPCSALAAKINDSGAGAAILVYSSGNGGLRLTSLDGKEQFGHPYFVIGDEADLA